MDLVLSWQLMDWLPQAWVAQCAAGGRVLSMVFVSHSADLTGLGFVRVTMDQDGVPRVAVATPHNGATSGSMPWTIRPASLEAVDDIYHVVCTAQADA